MTWFDEIRPISQLEAKQVIAKWHYSKVMPRITKMCFGGFVGNDLMAACTLGYGVRPLHTLKLAFPDLEVPDYLEIGKLCLSDDMPANSESYFMARMLGLIKTLVPQIKLIYTWADGIIGKPGYVYQASNFYYGGYIWTEMYLDEQGIRVHPRTMQGLSDTKSNGHFNSRSYEVTSAMGFTKYFGLQFRYVYPLCGKREWKAIQKSSPFDWKRGEYPKDDDCKWMVQVEKGKREPCDKPPFVITQYKQKDTSQLRLL
jgi:hypothetical protein